MRNVYTSRMRDGTRCRERHEIVRSREETRKGERERRDLELDADRKIRREKWRLTRRETNVIGCRQ